MLLDIKKLHASIEGKEILHGVDLDIQSGEIHAIMGPNGSGKSTLSYVILGHPVYKINAGGIMFANEDIHSLTPNERLHKGIFLLFQNPRSIAGVNMQTYLHTIYKTALLEKYGLTLDEARKDKALRKELSIIRFKQKLNEYLKQLQIDPSLMERNLNEGFSGGEKKKIEVLQAMFLEPKLMILDELDSGLDVDSLRICSQQVKRMQEEKGMSILLITHFTRIFNYIHPDHIHMFKDGCIQESGGMELAHKIEQQGYTEYCPDEKPCCKRKCEC